MKKLLAGILLMLALFQPTGFAAPPVVPKPGVIERTQNAFQLVAKFAYLALQKVGVA
jgi:hypothetical protein